MRKGILGLMGAAILATAMMSVAIIETAPATHAQGRSPASVVASEQMISAGPQALGAGVQQTGEVNTLSAAVASATRAQVIAAPASGSIYLRGLLIEKSTTATGSIIVSTGTGTNCGTSNAVITTISAATGQTLPFGFLRLEIQVPALGALCLATDAATTSVRAIGQ